MSPPRYHLLHPAMNWDKGSGASETTKRRARQGFYRARDKVRGTLATGSAWESCGRLCSAIHGPVVRPPRYTRGEANPASLPSCGPPHALRGWSGFGGRYVGRSGSLWELSPRTSRGTGLPPAERRSTRTWSDETIHPLQTSKAPLRRPCRWWSEQRCEPCH